MCGCCDCYCLERLRGKLKDGCIPLAIATAAIVITGVVLTIIIFGGPLRVIKITVEDGSLTRFDLVDNAPNMALAYISLTMSVRNPNWAIGIKHEKQLEAAYTYDGQQFDRAKLAGKGDKMAARKTVTYSLDVHSDQGRSVSLGNAGEAKYKEEEKKGVFKVDMKVTGKFKYTLRKTKCVFEATCPVKLQLAKPDTAAVVFQKVGCEVTESADEYCKMVY
jgi:hypothetical protein